MTAAIEYRTLDKRTWGDGQWQQEPDKVQWTDEATGLPCLAVRGPHGALCGYVGVAEGHPYFRVEYGDGPEDRLDVHGGITYSDLCQEGNEAASICHIPAPGQPDHVWWFGFDCAHSGDFCPGSNARLSDAFMRSHGLHKGPQPYEQYRTLAYVQGECRALAAQLAAAR
jgi:hypothetical protein